MAKALGFALAGTRLVRLEPGHSARDAARGGAVPGSAAGGVRSVLRLKGWLYWHCVEGWKCPMTGRVWVLICY